MTPLDPFQHVTRRLAIDGKPLIVLDGLFDDREIDAAYRFLNRLPFHLNDVDSGETAYARHWKAELLLDFVRATPVLNECAGLTPAFFSEASSRPLRLTRAHVNLHLYGDAQHAHTDLPGGVTALYYANPEWDEKWMGETLFCDDRREPIAAVAPKPGRVAIFDADLLHRAGVPSRECFAARLTVAFKYVRE